MSPAAFLRPLRWAARRLLKVAVGVILAAVAWGGGQTSGPVDAVEFAVAPTAPASVAGPVAPPDAADAVDSATPPVSGEPAADTQPAAGIQPEDPSGPGAAMAGTGWSPPAPTRSTSQGRPAPSTPTAQRCCLPSGQRAPPAA